MKNRSKLLVVALVIAGSLSCTAAAVATSPTVDSSQTGTHADQLEQAIEGSWRSPENVARDRYRHPRQTLEFFDVKPDMTVVEITPGGGWYSEILVPYLRDGGHYIGAVYDPASSEDPKRSEYYRGQLDALQKMFAANAAVYAAPTLTRFDVASPVLGEPASADRVLTFRNVHNWMSAGQAQGMFDAFFKVLKPGGVLGVVEHRATDGSDKAADDNAPASQSGYVETSAVLAFARNAGFELIDSSEINANPLDNHQHPSGVWTLPPSLRLGDKDREKYLAIGESDRMTLRFRKPDTAATDSQ